MSLQRRLTLIFTAIVILPLVAAGIVVQGVVVDEVGRRTTLSLQPALNQAVMLYNERVDASEEFPELAGAAVESGRFVRLVREGREREIDRFLENLVQTMRGIDFVFVVDDKGRVTGTARGDGPDFVTGFKPPNAGEIVAAAPGTNRGFHRTPPVDLRVEGTGRIASVIGGFWLDEDLLAGSAANGAELGIVAGDNVIASTADLERPVQVDIGGSRRSSGETFEVDVEGAARAKKASLDEGIRLLAWAPVAPISELSNRVLTWMVGLLLVALLTTAVLAYMLARLITQPLEELSVGAAAIAQGRFDHRIPVRSRDEVGRLAVAFNHMTDRLRATITELSSSRDRMQRAVQRVGETLRSTHDMRQILESILNTAADAVDAHAAVLWMLSPTRDELYPTIGRGLSVDDLQRVRVGNGIVGLAAERGVTIRLPSDVPGPRPATTEPGFPVVIALPLYGQDRMMGVITLYRPEIATPFSRGDLETVTFLTEQGAVAIENVSLHEEAQRLSLTDGLTGVWNRRYFQMQFRQVVATAARFNRTFSVLMLDLDNFKLVNDTYGHQRGDAVLVEFAHRVNGTLREVDTFARYGGEEFICLLTETDVRGAVVASEKILEGIRSEPFTGVGEEPIRLTVSIGVASYPEHGDSYRILVEAADRGLYKAKQAGRDRVAVADPQPPPELKLAT